MKAKLFTIAIASLAIACNQQSNNQSVSLTNQVDSTSFAIGVNVAENLGKNIAQQFEEVNLDLLKAGLNAGIDTNNKSEISGAVAEQIIEEFFKSKQELTAKKAQGEGAAFLAENAKREGVISLESGLQYEILTEGNGQIPTINDKITAHYHGTLIDGTVFDSSVDRGEPASFPVNGVIAGWTEALQIMPVGSKWKLYVPSDLAYGERGAGQIIGPYSTLIFEVELLSID
jgi:FKBP-type peptidyl-prolyl cis-trans isomerase FklB